MTCDRCDAKGCRFCKGQWRTKVTTTLHEHVADVSRYIDYFVWADGGTFPVAGGVLDQSRIFLRLYRAWRNASRIYKAQ